MKIQLTDLMIQGLHWTGKTALYFDDKVPSFGIRIGRKTKTFFVVRGVERKVITIGHYPSQTLKNARRDAQIALAIDNAPSLDYAKAIITFLEDVSGQLKQETAAQYKRYLEAMDFKDIAFQKADVSRNLLKWAGKPWAQNYAYASLRCFLNWCLERELIPTHPLIHGKPPNKTRSRERVLTDSELGRVWRCTDDSTYGRILRLLILTGQRRIEVAKLKPEDIADGLITFHTKGDKLNIIPVTSLMQENLTVPFKFNDWSGAHTRFIEKCGVEFRRHDLRRTLATKLAQLGVDFIVIERILGHAQHGVAFVYNRYGYMEEVKNALLRYEQHVLKVSA